MITHKKRIGEELLMGTHNITFSWRNKKTINEFLFGENALSGAIILFYIQCLTLVTLNKLRCHAHF